MGNVVNYSIKDISNITNRSIKFIRREIASGNLKSFKLKNKTFVSRNDFNDWNKHINDYEKKYSEDKNFTQNKSINKSKREKDIVNWIDITQEMNSIDYWKNKNASKKYNFIDLFTGAGGLSCGLVMAGFNPVGSVEIMPQAVETYKYNFSKMEYCTGSVSWNSSTMAVS